MKHSDQDEMSQQISYTQELLRKATHLFALVIPGGYWFLDLSRNQMLLIMVPIALVMIVIDLSRLRKWWLWRVFVVKLVGKMVREHEQNGNFIGATYILVAVCITVAVFSKPIAVAALAFVVVGDMLAAVIGRALGKHRFGRKSIEGSLGCLAGTALVALVAPNLPLTVGLMGAVVATVAEALPWKVDDNLTMPLFSGLSMTLVGIVGNF